MKILVEGNINRKLDPQQFACKKCGCVFEATNEEYKYSDSWTSAHDNAYAQCYCPCCKAMVYLYEDERRTNNDVKRER